MVQIRLNLTEVDPYNRLEHWLCLLDKALASHGDSKKRQLYIFRDKNLSGLFVLEERRWKQEGFERICLNDLLDKTYELLLLADHRGQYIHVLETLRLRLKRHNRHLLIRLGMDVVKLFLPKWQPVELQKWQSLRQVLEAAEALPIIAPDPWTKEVMRQYKAYLTERGVPFRINGIPLIQMQILEHALKEYLTGLPVSELIEQSLLVPSPYLAKYEAILKKRGRVAGGSAFQRKLPLFDGSCFTKSS
jgi:hypothetical protein